MLIGGGLIMLMGLITKNKTWYQASLLLIGVIFICRIISIVFDGYINDLLPAGINEMYIIAVIYFASKQPDHSKKYAK